ncbi:CG13741, partial [Drosophila busckii]
IIVPVDDYYDKCVEPKISIPKRYPGVTSSGFKRQAARLRSYKEIDAMNDDEQEYEDDEDNENSQKYDEAPFIDSPIYESNESQIDFEINDFNRLYDEVDDNGSHGHEQMPANSAQWRIQPNNVNRPAGSAPLVPNNYRGRGRRRNRYNQNNNNLRGSVHSRLGYNMNMRNQQQGMLNAYNNFSNQGGRAPQQVVTNINAHF